MTPAKFGITAATVAMAVVSIVMGQLRFVARDEGFYLYAARLISEGALPYRDFFFPQTPVTPYVYAAAFLVTGPDWLVARVIASLLTVLTGVLLAIVARRRFGETAAIVTLVIFTTSVCAEAWLPTAQTDSIAIPLMLAAIAAADLYRRPAAAGALFGFAVLARLTLAPVGVVFLPFLLATDPTRSRRIGSFLLGLSVPVLIGLCFASFDVHNFVAHNFTYHTQRTALTPEAVDAQRWKVLRTLFGLRSGVGAGGLQFTLVVVPAILLIACTSRRRILDPFFLAAVILFSVHLIPAPTYIQYFCVVSIPLMPFAAAAYLAAARALGRIVRSPVLAPAVMVGAILVAYAACGIDDFRRFTESGDGVIGVGAVNSSAWRLKRVRPVSDRIDTAAGHDERVLASWSGYLVETKAHAVAGLESHFGPGWAEKASIDPTLQDRLKISSWERAAASLAAPTSGIRRDQPNFAVVFHGRGRTTDDQRAIVTAGGIPVWTMDGITLYRARTKLEEQP